MWLFVREQKLLVVLLLLSILVLIAGVVMIQVSKKDSHEQADTLVQDVDKNQQTMATMNAIAQMAEQNLTDEKLVSLPAAGVGDIKPQESIDRVAALNGRVPEVGSDDWCEVMMIKDANAWTLEEKQLFAQHCL